MTATGNKFKKMLFFLMASKLYPDITKSKGIKNAKLVLSGNISLIKPSGSQSRCQYGRPAKDQVKMGVDFILSQNIAGIEVMEKRKIF